MKARVCPFLLAAHPQSAAETQRAKRALSSLAIASRQIPTFAALPAASKRRRGASCAPQKRSAAAHPQGAAETQRAKRARPPWQLRPGKFQSPPRFPPHQNAGAARFASAKSGPRPRIRKAPRERGPQNGRGALAIAPPASSNPRRASRRIKTPARRVSHPQKRSAAAHPQSAAGNAARKTGVVLFGNCAPANFQPSPRFPPHQNAGAARLAPAKAVPRPRIHKAPRKRSPQNGRCPLGNCAPQIPTLAALPAASKRRRGTSCARKSGLRPRKQKAPRKRGPQNERGRPGNCAPASSNPRRAGRASR